jgi:2-amino-4-hydroxy-6-hydroxymethyldihydropteridine diphosphokinase
MNYSVWKSYYKNIVEDLNLDQKQDEIAAEIFDQLIDKYLENYINCQTLNDLINGKNVFIFGAAPSLDKDIKDNKKYFNDKIIFAADGATTAFLKYDIIPNVIVTDLDGIIADQIHANNNNAILIIHAHGDNITIIQKTIPKLKGSYFGTIQTNPNSLSHVKNFGGFTDGDRAVFIADHFHPKKIYLGGFDCAADPGFYSFQTQKNIHIKRKKLQWCHRLLQQFPKNYVKHL